MPRVALGSATADGGWGARGGGALWFLAVALGCGALAGVVAVRAVGAARREVAVVVALRAVAPLQRIPASAVHLAEVPLAAVPAGARRATAAVVGQFTRLGLAPGEVVTTAALDAGAAGLPPLDARLAALPGACPSAEAAASGAARGRAGACVDRVAVTLPLDANRGFDMVQQGDSVDVAASYPLQVGTVSQVIATAVPVLERLASPVAAQTGGGDSGWLVLGCSPGTALRLQLAMAAGKVSVLLRPLGAAPEAPGAAGGVVDLTDLAAGGAGSSAAVPVAPPASAGVLPAPAGGAGS